MRRSLAERQAERQAKSDAKKRKQSFKQSRETKRARHDADYAFVHSRALVAQREREDKAIARRAKLGAAKLVTESQTVVQQMAAPVTDRTGAGGS